MAGKSLRNALADKMENRMAGALWQALDLSPEYSIVS